MPVWCLFCSGVGSGENDNAGAGVVMSHDLNPRPTEYDATPGWAPSAISVTQQPSIEHQSQYRVSQKKLGLVFRGHFKGLDGLK